MQADKIRAGCTGPQVFDLRARNLWTDINDRAVEGGFYYRPQSTGTAIIRAPWLRRTFKGQINVLNCSTTMEMGVDIGGISAVVMNNVPPHPANICSVRGVGRSASLEPLLIPCAKTIHMTSGFCKSSWPFETKTRTRCGAEL